MMDWLPSGSLKSLRMAQATPTGWRSAAAGSSDSWLGLGDGDVALAAELEVAVGDGDVDLFLLDAGEVDADEVACVVLVDVDGGHPGFGGAVVEEALLHLVHHLVHLTEHVAELGLGRA